MKRKFVLFIGVFVIGLSMVIGVVAWNLSSFATTLKSEREQTVAFYRTSVDSSRLILSIVADTDKLFQAGKHEELQSTQIGIDRAFTEVASNIELMSHPKFSRLLQTSLDQRSGAGYDHNQPDGGDESGFTSYADLVSAIDSGMAEVTEAYSDVKALAETRLRLTTELAPLKKDLSKVLRKSMDLRDVDPKAFNNLARGVITVLYTDSNRDVKFAGNAKFLDGYEKLNQKELTQEQRARLVHIKELFDQTYDRARLYIASQSDSQFFSRKARDVVHHINTLEAQVQQLFDGSLDTLIASSTRTMYTAMSIGCVVTLISVTIGIFLARNMTRRIGLVVERFKDIAQGDFTQTVHVTGHDEIAQLGESMNTTTRVLSQLISEVRDASSDVANASTQIASSCDQTSNGMNTQEAEFDQISSVITEMATGMAGHNDQVVQISAAIEQMSNSVIEVARKSLEVSETAAHAGQVAESSGEVVNQTIEDINAISTAVSDGAAAVTELGKRGEQIGQIIGVINEIADQTNLLALNAAIEAARAGEHGRGFAVVADEVRKLADRTTKATDKISQSIKEIQTETGVAVEKMQVGTDKVNTGVKRATEAGQSLQQIVDSAKEVACLIQSIAAAAEEQSATSEHVTDSVKTIAETAKQQALHGEEVTRSVESISEVTSQAVHSTRTSASTAAELSDKAGHLQQLLDRFKVNRPSASTP